MSEKRHEEVMHEFIGGEGVPSAPEKMIRNYQKGDAPEVRVAYLQGVILQDGQFISEGKCFFIGEEPSDQRVSLQMLFVEKDDQSEENIEEPMMLTYQEALDHLDEFADEEIEEAFDKCDDSSSISIERAVSTVVASMKGAARAVAFIYGKTCDEVDNDMVELLERKVQR